MDSPFSHLFDTNYIPTSEELIQINNFLVTPRLRVENLDEELKVAQAKVDAILAERQRITEVIDKHISLLAPIRRLSDDLLGEIFLQTLPEAEIAGSMAHTESPMVLTRICSRWRRLALETPGLWTSLYIDIPIRVTGSLRFSNAMVDPEYELREATQVVQSRVRGVTEWLLRSGALPLTIRISCPEENMTSQGAKAEESFVSQMIAAILPHISRLQEIACKPIGPSLTALLTLPPSTFPILRSVMIWQMFSWIYSDIWAKIEDFGLLRAEKVRTIGLSGIQAFPLSPSIPWPQLINLHLELSMYDFRTESTLGLNNFIACLGQCVGLVNFRLDIGRDTLYMDDGFPTAPITLPNLKSLCILDSDNVTPIISFLTVPILEDFDYSRRSNFNNHLPDPDQDTEPFLLYTFLEASSNLKTLTLNPDVFPIGTVIACLRQCPFLQKLNLRPRQPLGWYSDSGRLPIFRIPFSNSDLLELLSGKAVGGESCLCEQLEEFVCTYTLTVAERDVLQFLKRKQSSATPLRRLFMRVQSKSPSDPTISEEIKSHCEVGAAGQIQVKFVTARRIFPLSTPTIRRELKGEDWFYRTEDPVDGER